MKEKSNKKMMILSFLGIIFVVLGHMGDTNNILDIIFPFYSFHMALFIFISGYFYKESYENNLKEYIFYKFKKLVIPYFAWNVVYGLILVVLKHYNVVVFGDDFNLYSLFVRPWIDGHQFSLNIAGWFILALFLVNVVYILIRILMKKLKIWNDYVFLSIFFLICVVSVVYSLNASDFMIPILRTGFFMFFYQFGLVYKSIEGKIKLDPLLKLGIIVIIQIIILHIEPSINYYAVFMKFSGWSGLTPIITSITGILFWLTISDILLPIFKDNGIVNYVSCHTKEIMFHHIFWIFIINSILKIINVPNFDNGKYMTNVYYLYTFGISYAPVFYSFICLIMPVLVHFIYEKFVYIFKNVLGRKAN